MVFAAERLGLSPVLMRVIAAGVGAAAGAAGA
jgi:predicted naringenin-chalcone synthase